MKLCSWRGRCCSSCRLRDLGRHMGMNMEQKMVEKFMSRRGQQKLTQDLLQLTWRTREDLMMGSMKSLTRCMSQIKCENWNMYKKNKKNSWIWSKHHWHQGRDPCYIQWPLEQVLSEEQIEVNNWKNTGTTSNDSLQNLTMESCSEKAYLGNADKQRTRWAKQYLWIYSRLVYEYSIWLEVTGAKRAFWCI